MSFGGLFDGGSAMSQPRLLSGLSLGLQTNMEGQREVNRIGFTGGNSGNINESIGRNKNINDSNINENNYNKREMENDSESYKLDGGGGSPGDEFDQDQDNPRKRKKYHRHTPQQIQELEALFKECPHPDEKQRLELSRRLNLDTRQVKFWFQNRRTQMKTQIERHENSLLKNENDKLRAENMSIKEALHNPICTNCGGPVMLGESTLEEQHLRLENARLKDELERVCALAGKFIGRPLPNMSSSLDLAVGLNNAFTQVAPTLSVVPDYVTSPLGSVVTPSNNNSNHSNGNRGLDGSVERSMLLELALVAMDELVKMAQLEEPLWVRNGEGNGRETLNFEEYERRFARCIGPKPVEYVAEATRENGMVIVNSMALVETLMDATRWADMFPCLIARTTTTDIISSGMGGTRNGALLLMHAELQVLSPLVPIREVNFLRFCKQHAEGIWAVVDVSIDGIRDYPIVSNGNMCCRRLPSGCIVQDMPNGYSKVTWVEHAEYDESMVHQLYRPLLRSGMGLGAQRWIATLQRQCECLAILMSSSVITRDHTVITTSGRRSMLKLAQRMTQNFCAGVCASSAHKWSKLNSNGNIGEDVRVMSRQSMDDPGEPPGVVLSAATSVWLPLSPQRIFDFLRDERLRSKWDILSNGGPMQEMASIAKGQDHGNAVSLLRSNGGNANQSSMLILQETCTDASGSLVVYAPVDIPAMHLVMNGGDSAYVALLPSGFAIIPDGPSTTNGSQQPGSLLTVAFQILVNTLPTSKLTVESVETVNNLITCTVQKIKAAINLEN